MEEPALGRYSTTYQDTRRTLPQTSVGPALPLRPSPRLPRLKGGSPAQELRTENRPETSPPNPLVL